MLKKAGIVVAAIAAATLAMSPLAFAGGNDSEKSDKDHSKSDHDKKDDDEKDDEDKKDEDKKDDDDKDDEDKKDEDKKDDDDKDDEDKKKEDEEKDDEPEPVVTETNNEDNVSGSCSFDQDQTVTDTNVSGNGVLGVLNLALDVVAPIGVQAPILSCNTVGITDTFDSNAENVVENDERTRIVNSGNEG